MKKHIATFIGGGFLGFVAGAGLMLVLFPFFFPPAEVNEKVAVASGGGAAVLLAETAFRTDSPGQDAGHWGRGGIKIYRDGGGDILVELQADFEVGPGPNFWLYLNAKGDIDTEDDFYADDARIKAAKIKSFTGSQVYQIAAADYDKTKAITIWCETFGQYIASANIPPQISGDSDSI
ncbi:MAG: DM13 domain-containing protein [Gammaproteobacteria bacterium]